MIPLMQMGETRLVAPADCTSKPWGQVRHNSPVIHRKARKAEVIHAGVTSWTHGCPQPRPCSKSLMPHGKSRLSTTGAVPYLLLLV